MNVINLLRELMKLWSDFRAAKTFFEKVEIGLRLMGILALQTETTTDDELVKLIRRLLDEFKNKTPAAVAFASLAERLENNEIVAASDEGYETLAGFDWASLIEIIKALIELFKSFK